MRTSIRTVTPRDQVPLVFPVAEAKRHLVVDHDDDDALIDGYIRAAQAAIEDYTSQVLTARTLMWTARGWPRLPEPVRLWRTPVTGITGITYADPATGAQLPLAEGSWRWDELDGDMLLPALASDWPGVHAGAGASAIRVTFAAGYEQGLAPSPLVEAVRLTMAHFYLHREGGEPSVAALPSGALFLARPYRASLI